MSGPAKVILDMPAHLRTYHRNRRALAKASGICIECNTDRARPNKVKCEGCSTVRAIREGRR